MWCRPFLAKYSCDVFAPLWPHSSGSRRTVLLAPKRQLHGPSLNIIKLDDPNTFQHTLRHPLNPTTYKTSDQLDQTDNCQTCLSLDRKYPLLLLCFTRPAWLPLAAKPLLRAGGNWMSRRTNVIQRHLEDHLRHLPASGRRPPRARLRG